MKNKVLALSSILLGLILTSCGETPTSKADPTTVDPTTVEPTSDSSIEKFLVSFMDEEGNLLEAKEWEKGAVPSYNYQKQDTDEFDYTVLGWSDTLGGEVITIPAVSEEATYYAVVNAVKKQYTITFESNGGTSIAPITEDYGTEVVEPENPKKEGYAFVAWSFDQEGKNVVTWPYKLVKNVTLYANYNEAVDIKSYLKALISVVGHNPNSYIPESMTAEYSANLVTRSEVMHDYNNFVSVNSIKAGFGEQWNMVIENIKESERFYDILSICETIINDSVVLFNNYLDNNPGKTATHTLDETSYTAKIDFNGKVLTYSLRYKTGWTIPFFGEICPQIDMIYNILTLEKSVRIQLTENNAMKYLVLDNHYEFAIMYGLSSVNRKAYFEITRNEDETIDGHIYEYVPVAGKDLVPSCADFYIGKTYTSVVGNKARGLIGFKGYINELYETDKGILIGYEVLESWTYFGLEKDYHTFWFNLANITGLSSVKAIENDNNTGTYTNKNPHDIYINGLEDKFKPTYNQITVLGISKNTSRKYDIEIRTQYFYGYEEGEFTQFKCDTAMMFIQDGENFNSFASDVSKTNNAPLSVNLENIYLNKIRDDHSTLIDILLENKDKVTGDTITAYIGNALPL